MTLLPLKSRATSSSLTSTAKSMRRSLLSIRSPLICPSPNLQTMRWFSSPPTDQERPPAPLASASSAPAASTSQLPPDHPPVPAGTLQCPVDESARATWLEVAEASEHPMKAAANPALAPKSGYRLGTEREVSSIPRSASSQYSHSSEQAARPADIEEEKGNWVYPSEQQFFNAMMRKNHNPRAADMRTIVPIHNAVNEKAWEEVLMWEAGKGGDRCGGIRLSSFVGRPKERSPKAWAKGLFG